MVLNYFIQLTREFAFEEVRPGMLGPAIVRREPVGVAAAIVPWNVPLFVAMLKLAPALAAGATLVIKPAPETPLDGMILADGMDGSLTAAVGNALRSIPGFGRRPSMRTARRPFSTIDRIAARCYPPPWRAPRR